MISKSFVSIIIPVFNTPEPILRSCFESVKNQSNSNWELIVIDDGSSEENAKIIDRLCIGIPNTRIFHKANEGVSSARNEAVKYATGEWITFLDSDNTLPSDAVQKYLDTVVEKGDNDTDVLIGFCISGTRVIKDGLDIITLDNDIQDRINYEKEVEIINSDKEELVNHLLTNSVKRWSSKLGYFTDGPVGKLIRRELAEKVSFPLNLRWEEDTVWLLNTISKSKKILVTYETVYNNIEYIYSATRRYRPDCIQEFYEVCVAEKEIKTMFPMCKSAFAYKRFSNILLVSRLYFFHKDNETSEKQLFKEFVAFVRMKETKDVCNDVLKYLNEKTKRNFIYRIFSFAMKIGCYFLCWNILKYYCRKREK